MVRFPEISWQVCLLWALMLLVLPLQWLFAAVFSAAMHECGHLLALYLTGERVDSLRIGFFGAEIRTGPLPPDREMICAAAGPAVSLILWLFHPVFPRMALCGLVQGLYNLLPVYPLDGGRMIRCILGGFLADSVNDRICGILRILTGLLLCILLICFLGFREGLPLFLLCSFFLRKIPCKDAGLGVQ